MVIVFFLTKSSSTKEDKNNTEKCFLKSFFIMLSRKLRNGCMHASETQDETFASCVRKHLNGLYQMTTKAKNKTFINHISHYVAGFKKIRQKIFLHLYSNKYIFVNFRCCVLNSLCCYKSSNLTQIRIYGLVKKTNISGRYFD